MAVGPLCVTCGLNLNLGKSLSQLKGILEKPFALFYVWIAPKLAAAAFIALLSTHSLLSVKCSSVLEWKLLNGRSQLMQGIAVLYCTRENKILT